MVVTKPWHTGLSPIRIAQLRLNLTIHDFSIAAMSWFKHVLDRVNSFKFAIQGIGFMIKSQQNAWIHAVVTGLVVFTGWFFGFTKFDWCWVVLAMISVWTAEAFNTALECLTDAVSSEFHPLLGKAKDVAAGAVLITAVGAIIIGLLIIGPYLWEWINLTGR
ncbi:MAG: diacylglycerol kinase family protein [bacterium]